ncbi:MAG: hypothetical protein DI609_10515 [Corynebacterium urealyticum]|uniref:Uncharacterized protein n=1 Tax=Corynebacterium urealyticum TaxID=43771 RepID=A0A2W5AVJ5_9CORY|nr:MAG: hypothetical protein DI609_10515 [Corynebacterium urealyticum]
MGDAVVVAEGAGVDESAASAGGFGGLVFGLFVLPGVVDEGAEESGAFGVSSAIEFALSGFDCGVADSGLASSAQSAGKLVFVFAACLFRLARVTVRRLATFTTIIGTGRVGSGRVG